MTDAIAEAQDEAEIEDVDESIEVDPSAHGLSYFGTDFDVRGLVGRLDRRDIRVPSFDPDSAPEGSKVKGFQRAFVWTKPQQDRFVESLLLGYPVPGIFLVEEKDKTLLVLDGQQRLTTLQIFYGDPRFELQNVTESLRGLSYRTLDDTQRRTLDNTFIHATVVRYGDDREPDAVYQLFERLNTGGTTLQSHEIRVALYNGPLIRWIRDLNENDDWRALVGRPSKRLKDQELILRFFALYLRLADYERPLKHFLNDFAEDHQYLDGIDVDRLTEVFTATVAAIRTLLGDRAFRIKRLVNAAVADSLMVAAAQRLETLSRIEASCLEAAHARLFEDPEYVSSVTRSTSDEESVHRRMALARAMFDKCIGG